MSVRTHPHVRRGGRAPRRPSTKGLSAAALHSLALTHHSLGHAPDTFAAPESQSIGIMAAAGVFASRRRSTRAARPLHQPNQPASHLQGALEQFRIPPPRSATCHERRTKRRKIPREPDPRSTCCGRLPLALLIGPVDSALLRGAKNRKYSRARRKDTHRLLHDIYNKVETFS